MILMSSLKLVECRVLRCFPIYIVCYRLPCFRPRIYWRQRWTTCALRWPTVTYPWSPTPRCGRNVTPRSSIYHPRTDTRAPISPARRNASNHWRNDSKYVNPNLTSVTSSRHFRNFLLTLVTSFRNPCNMFSISFCNLISILS